MSVRFRGREVRNPLARFLLAFLIIPIGILAALLAIVLLPVTLPLHLLFRLFGRRGFFYTKPGDRGITYSIGFGAFLSRHHGFPAARVVRRF